MKANTKQFWLAVAVAFPVMLLTSWLAGQTWNMRDDGFLAALAHWLGYSYVMIMAFLATVTAAFRLAQGIITEEKIHQ